jgi:hypothetical protein
MSGVKRRLKDTDGMIFIPLGTLSALLRYLCGGRYRIPAVPIKVMRCNARLALIFWLFVETGG